MAQLISHESLSRALLDIVRQLNFGQVLDSLAPEMPLRHFPSLDLSVVVFPHDAAPVSCNVLFSRDFPLGHVAQTGDTCAHSCVSDVHFLADQLDVHGNSIAWLPRSDWDALTWRTLQAPSREPGVRFVQPYPASLVKLMVAVALAHAVDLGRIDWGAPWQHGDRLCAVSEWAESMLVASNNDATSAMVAILHAVGLLAPPNDGGVHAVHALFRRYGLATLRLDNTHADGGWRNANGAGVGQLQMTSWDCVRLLWLLRHDVPSAPWVDSHLPPLLSRSSQARVWSWLGEQGLHEILSSTTVAGVSGWQCGIPAHLHARWITPSGSVQVEDKRFPADVRTANAQTSVSFAHKTGNTDNYASDAGWVSADTAGGRRYLIALISNLGRRYAPAAHCATDWRVPRLGCEIDRWLKARLE